MFSETDLIQEIKKKTQHYNKDNVTRTKAYLKYYFKHPEIKWALLASMVSRNAGWNMTDLLTFTYNQLLSKNMRMLLFKTYERANWFIFSDAFPQLLLYSYSVKCNKPLFYLFKYFTISTFMEEEWLHFWTKRKENRLLTAQIINEQNIIQIPVIKEPFFRENVFHTFPYLLQELFHLNSVVFPTKQGDLYGIYIKRFTDTSSRIETGKKLASILFHRDYYPKFLTFANDVTPTGNRNEYEQFLNRKRIDSDNLQEAYPTISLENKFIDDWYPKSPIRDTWWESVQIQPKKIGPSFYRKRGLIRHFAKVVHAIKK